VKEGNDRFTNHASRITPGPLESGISVNPVLTTLSYSRLFLPMAIETLDIDELADRTGNLYETVAILSKRSRQVASDMRSELDDKLSYFEGFGPEMEDARMQEEQAKVSLEYEKKPEPTEIAIDEFLEDKIYYRTPDE
jgi:DNA-directed RNA polymerase subunit K/omega